MWKKALLFLLAGCTDSGGPAAPSEAGAAGKAAAGSSGHTASAGTGAHAGASTAGATQSTAGRATSGAAPGEGGGGTAGSANAGRAGANATGGATTTASGGATSGGASGGGASGGETSSGPPGVSISGRRILLDGEPFHIQGVCWNPVPRGGSHPQDLDYAGAVAKDVPLMAAAGINAVRGYEPITARAALDALHEAGIYVLNTVYPYGGNSVESAANLVADLKDHPAILMWVLGNEWNYNGLYVDLPLNEARTRLNQVAAAIKAVDTTHPIATVYGELPPADMIQAMPDIDVWGLNIYRGLSFGNTFSDWAARSEKPMFIAEYGADAWNATTGRLDTASQAEAVGTLTELIWNNGYAHEPNGVTAGGTIFEWNDEWWKDPSGSPDAQDVGGVAPGGGPHPDQTFNEEYWGLVDIDRNPRPAYEALRAVFQR